MEEKTVIQNIYGTVHGHVIGGDMQAPEGPHQTPAASGAAAAPTPQELRAQIQAARKLQASAWVRKYVNLPVLGLVGLLSYLGFRLAAQLSHIKQIAFVQSQSVRIEEVIVIGIVALTLVYWLNSLRREHDMVIEYSQQKIDQAKLALRFPHD